MSPVEYKEKFYCVDVDAARVGIQVLLYLHGQKVVYVDGWDGLGASAVLRSMATLFQSDNFYSIIYIDCSEWKSRRATQRAIAEELKLDSSVMKILDKEDDINGVEQGSRDLIQSVAVVINKTLMGTKFVMIFLNGTDDEVELSSFGIPHFIEFRNNIMLWTFKRRFLTISDRFSEMASREHPSNKLRYTHTVSSFSPGIRGLTNVQFEAIPLEEANVIVARNPCMQDINPKLVAECCLYELFLHYGFHTITKFGWPSHASNYWICDGIIQGDMIRDITNACEREINWKCDASLLDDFLKMFMRHLESPFLAVNDGNVYKEGPYRWVSVTSGNTELHGMQYIPATTSSFFLAFKTSDQLPNLPNRLIEHSSKLGVLILCCCAFNFASPPFLKCHSLRFLELDHCTDDKTIEGEDHTSWLCLYSLWVLDLRYTEWNEILSTEKLNLMTNIRELNIEGVWGWQYTAEVQGRLPNLLRFRLIKPTCQWDTSEDVDNSFTNKTGMEILDLSGNSDMENLRTSLSKASSLQMLVLDGCDGLEKVVAPGGIPPSLKSFRFDGCGAASQWTQSIELPPKHLLPSSAGDKNDINISKISLEGCTQMENLFLRGLPNLLELDLSGTAIKILDFKTMVVQVPRLKRLFLIGCKHLRAITYSHESGYKLKPNLELVCVDTRTSSLCSRPAIDNYKSFRLQVHAVVVDARLTRSLTEMLRPYIQRNKLEGVYFDIHLTVSPVYDRFVQSEATYNYEIVHSDQAILQQLIPAGWYGDVLSMVGNPPMQGFPQPPTIKLDRHMEIAEGSCYVESEKDALGELIGKTADSLHFHDVSKCVIIFVKTFDWSHLTRCCVERCPKVECVFPSGWLFAKLETFWASDLLMARWIWSKGTRPVLSRHNAESFKNLKHLHLRSCPRLQFVHPVWVCSFPSLETLHIIHCTDLVHVFELDGNYPEEIVTLGVLFPKLTTIHLHDLPKLHNICEVKMMAPALESIKIRGCWGLRRLPSVAADGQADKKPTVEIEKDVWEALEWDADHRPDHFEAPMHSCYYKKKLPRVSVLR